MSDGKPNPVDDLKQGLGLLFRAAKGAVEKLPKDRVEDVAKDAAKEVARAFESLGREVEKVIHPERAAQQQPRPEASRHAGEPTANEAEKRVDDAYAPDAPDDRKR